MREILFRGKSTETGKWREGYLLNVTLDGVTYNLVFGDDFARSGTGVTAMSHSCVYPETVGQYTGLTDKNGKQIFEGDIIKDEWGKIYKVIFTTKSCGFMAECTVAPNDYETGRYRIGDAWCNTIKVIGNIHDNPELVEGGAEDGQ